MPLSTHPVRPSAYWYVGKMIHSAPHIAFTEYILNIGVERIYICNICVIEHCSHVVLSYHLFIMLYGIHLLYEGHFGKRVIVHGSNMK